MTATTGLATSAVVEAVVPTQKTILDLPHEIQKEICRLCSQPELICLSLVCKSFHELAAAQLYRNFHIVFPDDDDPCFDSPIDGLAGGLDTFVTSEYNYAKHLRDLSLDTLSSGHKAETAYKPYLYNVSCGKFMNTLLLLTLRKAKSLDSFRWNIRVELSRPVYKALHNIESLKNLHLRMQSGQSLYETPPPLPHDPSSTDSFYGTNAQWQPGPLGSFTSAPPPPPPPIPPPASFQPNLFLQNPPFAYHPTAVNYGPPPTITVPPPLPKPTFRTRPPRVDSPRAEPPTIAGFRNLESLGVLDIDNLDMIPELQTCLRNSASTLRRLKLSFSDNLAQQARKPTVDIEANDSDDDDEFQVVHVNAQVDDGNGPVRVFQAQEERKHQDAVLGRIFGTQPMLPRVSLKKFTQKIGRPSTEGREDRKHDFLEAIKSLSERLMRDLPLPASVSSQQEALDIIIKASKSYVEDVEKERVGAKLDAETIAPIPSSPKVDASVDSDEAVDDSRPYKTTVMPAHTAKLGKDRDEARPEDIDVAAPEEQLGPELQYDANDEITSKSEPSYGSAADSAPAIITAAAGSPSKPSSATLGIEATKSSTIEPVSSSYGESGDRSQKFKQLREEADAIGKQLESLRLELNSKDIERELYMFQAEIEDANDGRLSPQIYDEDDLRRQISEYGRNTRGIPLKSLCIHQIPVKASVLGRAIDLRTLTRVTLLNVGNQAPFWTLMAKENKLEPLPLRKIFTDNVSVPFLHLVSQLDSVEELFMLERNAKYKPESLAPKTKITLAQIRRAILKKHLPTIKRLLIKNQADLSWDMDEKTTQLICKRGKALEELAVVMGINAMHSFLQYLSSLVNLRALHVISFRNDDTCLSVMRETRRFIVDTVSHHPELQLEYICLGDEDRADRIMRESEMDERRKKTAKGKGKGVVPSLGVNTTMFDPFPVVPTDGNWELGSSSEDEDEEGRSKSLRLGLADGVMFYDIWGVRIFDKDVVSGRL